MCAAVLLHRDWNATTEESLCRACACGVNKGELMGGGVWGAGVASWGAAWALARLCCLRLLTSPLSIKTENIAIP